MHRSFAGVFVCRQRRAIPIGVAIAGFLIFVATLPAHAGILPAQSVVGAARTAMVALPTQVALAVDGSGPAVANAPATGVFYHRKRLLDEVTTRKEVLLTFDDGPNPHTTPGVLAALRQHKMRAVFFVVGMNARKYPELIKQIHAEGHIIGNHTFYHCELPRFGADRIQHEIRTTNDLVEKITGVRPKLFRPPYGAINHRVLKVLNDEGMDVMLWTVDPYDWRCRNAARVLAKVTAVMGLDTAHPRGGVILLHDIFPSTVATLEPLLTKIQATRLTQVAFLGNRLQAPAAAPIGVKAEPTPILEFGRSQPPSESSKTQIATTRAASARVQFNPAVIGNPLLQAWLEPSFKKRADVSMLALLKAKQRGTLVPFMLAAHGTLR